MIKNLLFKRTINSRRKKYTSIRTLRLFIYQGLFSKIPLLRDYYSIYTETIAPEKVGEALIDKAFDESFSLSQHEFEYLNSIENSNNELIENRELHLKKRCQITLVHDCSILGKVNSVLHRPTKKLLTRKPLHRNMVKMFHYQSVRKIDPLVIPFISTVSGHKHYFHFILDRLITLLYILQTIPSSRSAAIIIRNNIPEFQKRAFNYLEKQYPELSFIQISNDERIDCTQLLIPERETARPIDNLTGGEAINAIRKLYIREYEISEQPPSKYIYISRSRQKQRRTLNEEQLFRQISGYGFTLVHPELLSHEEQVSLFNSAKMIIATTGAALTNLIFCPPECKVIEIRPAEYDYPLFIGLCKQVGLDHYYFRGSSIKGKDMFSVDVDALCTLIENCKSPSLYHQDL